MEILSRDQILSKEYIPIAGTGLAISGPVARRILEELLAVLPAAAVVAIVELVAQKPFTKTRPADPKSDDQLDDARYSGDGGPHGD
jgi:hypothetical protein